MSTPAQTLREQLAGLTADIQAKMVAAQSIRDEIEQLECTAYSPDRAVSVTVGAGGKVTDLVLDPALVVDGDAVALANQIRTTLDAALSDLAQQAERLTDRLTGS